MELEVYLRFVLALIFVLGLIGGCALLARRFGFGGRMIVQAGQRQRLSVVEIRPIDVRHKLVLVKRDDSEHLLMIGPANSHVVESGISSSAIGASALSEGEPA